MLLAWPSIETIFLDMDGTILDLRFDNYFWLEYLPRCYAQKNGLATEQATKVLLEHMSSQQGKLNWYCLDYWTQELQLPILQLKEEVSYLIAWRHQAEQFLHTIKHMGKRIVLITNAHPSSLALKMEKVNLAPWFDRIISAHDYGYPKEQQAFWQTLQQQLHFNPDKSAFIDDSVSVLKSAKQYGMKYLGLIMKPDSSKPSVTNSHQFIAINDFMDCFASF